MDLLEEGVDKDLNLFVAVAASDIRELVILMRMDIEEAEFGDSHLFLISFRCGDNNCS